MRYDDASNTGSMAADFVLTARPDVDFLPKGDMVPATGNTITGAGTTSGAAGADLVGDAPGTDRRGQWRRRPRRGLRQQLPGQWPVRRPQHGCAGQLQLRAQRRHARRRAGRVRLHPCRPRRSDLLDDPDGQHRPRPHHGSAGRRPGRGQSSAGRRAFRHSSCRARPRHQHARRHADGDPGRRGVRAAAGHRRR